jgi:probable rRNA maturation factor
MIEYAYPSDFTVLEADGMDNFDPDSGELILGDIVISVDKVLEQAEKYNHAVKREYAFLIAHSMLHLFGYDHMDELERENMELKQDEILTRLGITR